MFGCFPSPGSGSSINKYRTTNEHNILETRVRINSGCILDCYGYVVTQREKTGHKPGTLSQSLLFSEMKCIHNRFNARPNKTLII